MRRFFLGLIASLLFGCTTPKEKVAPLNMNVSTPIIDDRIYQREIVSDPQEPTADVRTESNRQQQKDTLDHLSAPERIPAK